MGPWAAALRRAGVAALQRGLVQRIARRRAQFGRQAYRLLQRQLAQQHAQRVQRRGRLNALNERAYPSLEGAGLDGVEMYGRAGWLKPLKALGWTGGVVLLETNAAEGER